MDKSFEEACESSTLGNGLSSGRCRLAGETVSDGEQGSAICAAEAMKKVGFGIKVVTVTPEVSGRRRLPGTRS